MCRQRRNRQNVRLFCRIVGFASLLIPYFLPLLVVVYHLDGEDNHTTSERDEVGE